MIYSILIGVGVVIAALLVVGFFSIAAFFASFTVMRWLSKPGKDEYFNIRYKDEYFNIRYKHKYGSKFYRAHLVGKVDRPNNSSKVLYLAEIHPEDADQAYAWTVPETKIRGGQLLEKGRFYRYVFEEELYD